MIVAIYKEQDDATKRAGEERGAVVPTKEANLAVAARWPDYPWAVVVPSPSDPGTAWAGRQAEAALAAA